VAASALLETSALAARLAVTDVVIAYATGLDSRDWTGFRALFEDVIDLDYSSLKSISGRIAAEVWVDRVRVLGGFDATQHKLSNFRVVFDDAGATVTSYVDAAHFIHADGRDLAAFACGTYVHRLSRHGADWKIAGCTFTVAGYQTGRAAFDEAFAAARAAYEARSGA
jgi:hypothetical protein